MAAHRRAAFTLTELIIVIAIIGILTGVGMGTLAGVESRRLEGEARTVVADLGWARHRAVATRQSSIVVFDPAQDRYIVYRESIAPANELKRHRFRVDLVSVAPGPAQLTFSPPSGAAQTQQIILSHLGKTRQVDVFGQTGYVKSR